MERTESSRIRWGSRRDFSDPAMPNKVDPNASIKSFFGNGDLHAAHHLAQERLSSYRAMPAYTGFSPRRAPSPRREASPRMGGATRRAMSPRRVSAQAGGLEGPFPAEGLWTQAPSPQRQRRSPSPQKRAGPSGMGVRGKNPSWAGGIPHVHQSDASGKFPATIESNGWKYPLPQHRSPSPPRSVRPPQDSFPR